MKQPHVLFFMCDQMQYQRQGKIDSVAHTPNFSVNMPHPPFEVVENFADQYALEDMVIPRSFYDDDLSDKPQFLQDHMNDGNHGIFDDDELPEEMRQYYTMISEVDRLFGEVRRVFEEKGMWDNTLALFTSDHGDMMGGHRMKKKGTIPYEEIFRVPFIVRLPENELKGQVADALAVNVSLPGTLIEGAGLKVPESFHGGSLMSVIRGGDSGPEEIYFEHYGAYWGIHPLRAVRTRDWKYVKYYGEDDTEELYNLANDPDELHNLIGDSEAVALRAKLEKMVDRWWDETGGKDAAYYESEAFKTRGGTIEEIRSRDVF